MDTNQVGTSTRTGVAGGAAIDPAARVLVIPVRPRAIGGALAAVGAVLLVTGVIAGLLAAANDPTATDGLARLAPNAEGSPLAWYGGALLLGVSLAAFLAGVIERGHSPHWWRWMLIAAVAAGLSMDEIVAIHENLRGAFLLVAAPIVVALAAASWPLFRSRPRPEQRAWVLGAGVYLLGGAVVDEIDKQLIGLRRLTPSKVWLNGLEEGLEMAGAIIVLLAFLTAAARFRAQREP